MSIDRWQHAGLKYTVIDKDGDTITIHNGDNMTQERQEIKDWGRTVVRLRREGLFADLLHAEIKVSDLTVKEIAAACNTSSASINKWKAGEVYPAAHLLYRLARCLHPVDEYWDAYKLYTLKINAERA